MKFTCLLLAILSSATFAADFQHLETRYGKVDVFESPGEVLIQHRGQAILKAEADGASLFRVSAETGNEYIIVNFAQGGLNCHGFFRLVEIAPSGAVKVSQDFGDCYELGGAGFVADDPLVHIKRTVGGNSAEMVSFLWRNGRMSKIFESSDSCRSLGFLATSASKKVNSRDTEKQVGGAGRLQFYSAPSDSCAKKGVFVLPEERLTWSLSFEEFVYVTYKNLKTGSRVDGWVHADRLTRTGK